MCFSIKVRGIRHSHTLHITLGVVGCCCDSSDDEDKLLLSLGDKERLGGGDIDLNSVGRTGDGRACRGPL